MKKARLRALTREEICEVDTYSVDVEMKKARLRALTLWRRVVLCSSRMRRNEESTTEGIDTFVVSFVVVFIICRNEESTTEGIDTTHY